MVALDLDFVECEDGWKHFWSFHNLVKVLYVLDLARLSDSIALFLKSLFLIEFH